ncbi:hypothetical protein N431DRAFT_441886, partial [Stipitochalara longipes BDJ]
EPAGTLISSSSKTGNKGQHTITAIAIAIPLLVVAALALGVSFILYRKHRKRQADGSNEAGTRIRELKDTFGMSPEADSRAIFELSDGLQAAEMKDTFGVHPEADSNPLYELSYK